MQSGSALKHLVRGTSPKLTEFKELDGASFVGWAPMVFKRDSPWPAGAEWPGDFNPNASYSFMSDWFLLMCTIAGYEELGGWLLRVNEQSGKDKYREVIKAIAAEGIFVPSMDEQQRRRIVRKYAFKGPYYDPTISEAVNAQRQVFRKKQADEAEKRQNKEVNVARSERVEFIQETTIVDFGVYDSFGGMHDEDDVLWFPELHQDGYTNEERVAIMAEGANRENDGDPVNRDHVRADEAMDAAAAAAAAGDKGQVHRKWQIICFEVHDAEGAQGGNDARGPVRQSRSDFHESLGAEYNEEQKEGGITGLLWAFICYDPDVNQGVALQHMMDWRARRDQYEKSMTMSSVRGRSDDEFFYSRQADPFWYLEGYRARKHPAFRINRKWLAGLVAQVSNVDLRADPDWMERAQHTMVLGDPASVLHPSKWATLGNALHVLSAMRCDTRVLQPSKLYKYYGQHGSDKVVNELGLIGLQAPPSVPRSLARPAQGELVTKAYSYSPQGQRQVITDGTPTCGLLDAYMPYLKGKTSLFQRMGHDDSNDGLADLGEVRDAQETDSDPYGLFKGSAEHLRLMQERNGRADDWRRYGASWDTGGDLHPHIYYASRKLMSETLKSFVSPESDLDAYHTIWCAAMRIHERAIRPYFDMAMNPDCPTNKYCSEMLKAIAEEQKKRKTPTATIYLQDIGKSIEQVYFETRGEDAFRAKFNRAYDSSVDRWGKRDPNHPGMDPFAHYTLMYVRQLRQVEGVEDPVLVFFCHKVASTCYHFRPGKLCPVIVVSAPAGEGKTYILKVIMKLMVKGTYRGENHLSTHGQTASNDLDVSILTDEAGGLLQHKKFADRKATEINKSAVAGTGTLTSRRAEYVMDKNGRKTLEAVETEVMHNKSYLIGTNLRRDDLVEEIAARTWFFDKKSAFLPAASLTWENIENMSHNICAWNQLQHMLKFSVYKAVSMGYIPAFDKMQTLDFVLVGMYHKLRNMGVRSDEHNAVNRIHDKIREACIDDVVTHAIAAAIHMPGGVCYKNDWELTLWKRISPLLYITKQVMLWNILGLQREWTGDSYVMSEMLKSAMRLANYKHDPDLTPGQQYGLDADGSIQWRRAKIYEKGDVYRAGPSSRGDGADAAEPEQHNADQSQGGTDAINLNYLRIQLNGTTYQAISDGMPDDCRLSKKWVQAHMERLAKNAVFRPPLRPYKIDTPDNLKGLQRIMTGRRADGGPIAEDGPRDIGSTHVLPVVEISQGRYGADRGNIYIAPEAIELLESQDLITAFFWASMSSQFRPQKFLVPLTHPKYHDVMDVIEVTESVRDDWVQMIDHHTASKYAHKALREGDRDATVASLLQQTHVRRVGGAAGADLAEGQVGWLEDDDVVLETVAGHDELTGDWAQDSAWLSRRNGLVQINHGHMDKVDKALLLSKPLMDDVGDEAWAEIREKAETKRGERFKLITVDLDTKAAYDRHKICGLPLCNDATGTKMRIQDPTETMRRYCEWMQINKPEGTATFMYPDDQIAAYDMGREGFRLIYDEFTVKEGAERAVDAAQQAIFEAKVFQKEKLANVRSKMSRFSTKRARTEPRVQAPPPIAPIFQQANRQQQQDAPARGLSLGAFITLSTGVSSGGSN